MKSLSKGLIKIVLFVLVLPISILCGIISTIQKLGGAETTLKHIVINKMESIKIFEPLYRKKNESIR